MIVDFNHWQGTQIADTEMSLLIERQDFQIIEMLRPEFHMDGNMYCFTYPSIKGLPNDCIQGFGETAHLAALDFKDNLYKRKAEIKK